MKTYRAWSRIAVAAILLALVASSFFAGASNSSDLKIELQLIWGADVQKSPDPKQKPVSEEVAKTMKASPFKWKNYFEVGRQTAVLPLNAPKKIQMSDKCTLEVTNQGEGRVEIKLFGPTPDKFVYRHTESVANGPIIIAGPAKDDTAWLTFVKQVK